MKSSLHPKSKLCAGATALAMMVTTSGATVLLQETFNNGVPNTEMEQPNQVTSDGKGVWFGSPESFYRGTVGDLQYEIPYTVDSPGMKIRALNYDYEGDSNGIDKLASYVIQIGTIKFEGWNANAAVFIRPRHPSSHLGYGYRFSPVGTANPPTAWNVYYRSDEGTSGTSTLIGTLAGPTPIVTNLQLRVRHNSMQLYADGVPFNTTPRPTQSTAGTGTYQRPLEIIVNAPNDAVLAGTSSIKVTLDNLSLIADDFAVPPFEDTPEGTLLVYEGFDYSASTLLNSIEPGGVGFVGPYMAEPSATTLLPLDSLSAEVLSPGYTFRALQVIGNRCSVIAPGTVAPQNARRSVRWIDMDNFPAHLTSQSNSVIRATGKKIWLSMLAGQEDTSKTGFFGLSLFDNHIESIFLGKASGAGGVWRIEGKGGVNSTGLSTTPTDQLAFLVVLVEWNHDGTVNADSTPVNPDKMYLWVNPDLNVEPDINLPSALAVRSVTVTNRNPYMHFNRVGFRGATAGGVLDEFRIGTTFRSVAPALLSPELSALRVGSDLQIRWKTAEGFVLQASPSLTDPAWAEVAQPVQTEGDQSFVNVPPEGQAKYFRLTKN